MFKKHPQDIATLLRQHLRSSGMETPLLQKRLIDSWEEVVGEMVAEATESKVIRNQTLYVKITYPALRNDLQMQRTEIMRKLNEKVGARVIEGVMIL